MIYSIYRLIHPITKDVFYVGRTRENLGFRLKMHLWGCKRSQTRISIYLQHLLSEDIRPIIELIEITTNPCRESFWIERYLPSGKIKNTWHPSWEMKGRKAA